MLGDGIVSLGVMPEPTCSVRKPNASAKIVWSSRTGEEIRIDGGVNSIVAVRVSELDLERRVHDLVDPAQRVDEVHVPGAAAKLAVGRGAQARVRLEPDGVADGLVLDRPKLVGADPALGVVRPGLVQLGRA